MRRLYTSGAFRVLAEVANQSAGISPEDPRLEPLWAMAEELDLPVGIHIGGGEPGTPYTRCAFPASETQVGPGSSPRPPE
jgi:predicted TIM-barrel fold metal-dependent hydrolase